MSPKSDFFPCLSAPATASASDRRLSEPRTDAWGEVWFTGKKINLKPNEWRNKENNIYPPLHEEEKKKAQINPLFSRRLKDSILFQINWRCNFSCPVSMLLLFFIPCPSDLKHEVQTYCSKKKKCFSDPQPLSIVFLRPHPCSVVPSQRIFRKLCRCIRRRRPIIRPTCN